MRNLSSEELEKRIKALMQRSDELYRQARFWEGRSEADYEENAAILKETELLIAELLRRKREQETKTPDR
jgi:hypothetical protein